MTSECPANSLIPGPEHLQEPVSTWQSVSLLISPVHPLNDWQSQPERISGKEYTIRADVWSTGITLLELVQKRFPFPNDVPPIELIMYIIGEVCLSLHFPSILPFNAIISSHLV